MALSALSVLRSASILFAALSERIYSSEKRLNNATEKS